MAVPGTTLSDGPPTWTGRKRIIGRIALSARRAHFQLSLIRLPDTGAIETSCTELNTRDRFTSSRLRMPGLISTRSLAAGTKFESEMRTA